LGRSGGGGVRLAPLASTGPHVSPVNTVMVERRGAVSRALWHAGGLRTRVHVGASSDLAWSLEKIAFSASRWATASEDEVCIGLACAKDFLRGGSSRSSTTN